MLFVFCTSTESTNTPLLFVELSLYGVGTALKLLVVELCREMCTYPDGVAPLATVSTLEPRSVPRLRTLAESMSPLIAVPALDVVVHLDT
jgi:hypothetical protein